MNAHDVFTALVLLVSAVGVGVASFYEFPAALAVFILLTGWALGIYSDRAKP